MKIQGKEKKTTFSLDYNTKSLKKSPKIIYVHLSFYGFKKLNNLEKLIQGRIIFRVKDYYLRRS